MISCRTATTMMSRGLDQPLSFAARAGLWTHLTLCGKCKRFRRNLALIEQWTRAWLRSDAPGRAAVELRPEVAAAIAERCRCADD